MIEYLLKNKITHFVIKYYEFSKITDYHNSRYQLFIYHNQYLEINKTWYKEPYYPKLKYRKLKEKDLLFFKENQELYSISFNNNYGRVYHPKEIDFDINFARKVI